MRKNRTRSNAERSGPVAVSGQDMLSRRNLLLAAISTGIALAVATVCVRSFQDDDEGIDGDLSPEKLNAIAVAMKEVLPKGARHVEIVLHPNAKRLVTIIRQQHLDLLTMDAPTLAPETLAVQEDIESIVIDLHDRYRLATYVDEGLDELGFDSEELAFLGDVLFFQQLGVKDSPTFEGFAQILLDEKNEGYPNMKKGAAIKPEALIAEVRQAGSFERWKNDKLLYAKETSLKFSGLKRAKQSKSLTVLPGESRALKAEIGNAIMERKMTEIKGPLVFDAREDHALDVALAAEAQHVGIVYGAAHEWTDNVQRLNALADNDPISLAVITPKRLPKYAK